ncbi:hypothetical protein ACFWXK_25410 [Streptomyces sp. NPDC059070]|uniref:hypothetical protein n=1 Tax=Streptomyces sp. NPDC059070 TaxID=3346713 RepID=UPI003675EDBD
MRRGGGGRVRARTPRAHGRGEPLRGPHSGRIGDWVAWLLAGTALLGALARPGVLTG